MSRRQGGFLIAILGADGAGKSTVTDLVVKMLPRPDLPLPAVRAYLGDDPPPGEPQLATTRWLHRRWEKADTAQGSSGAFTADALAAPSTGRGQEPSVRSSMRRRVARTIAGAAAMAEEYHQTRRAVSAAKGGSLVFLDRHFYYDYYFHHVAARPVSLIDRIHGVWVSRVLPRPALAICLDAPAELLYQRQPERTLEQRVARRAEYLEMADKVGLQFVDASRALPEVVEDVIRLVKEAIEGRTP